MVEIYGYIYKIENLLNGKVYIGQTTQKPKRRKVHHFYYLKRNAHANPHLQHAFNKYGESNFKFTVLNYATNKETLTNIEIDYIEHYDSTNQNRGYNIRMGGTNGKLSPETLKKISLANSGKNHPNYGKKHSPETCKKISEALKGKYVKENHPSHGRRNSTKTREQMARSHRGRGLFGFSGTTLAKNNNFEKRCWECRIKYKYHSTRLGTFEDPLSCEIVHDLVFNEIYRRG